MRRRRRTPPPRHCLPERSHTRSTRTCHRRGPCELRQLERMERVAHHRKLVRLVRADALLRKPGLGDRADIHTSARPELAGDVIDHLFPAAGSSVIRNRHPERIEVELTVSEGSRSPHPSRRGRSRATTTQLELTPAAEGISLIAVGLRSDLVRCSCVRLSHSPTTISQTGTTMNPKNPSGVRSDAPMTIVAHATGAGSIRLRRAPRPVASNIAAK